MGLEGGRMGLEGEWAWALGVIRMRACGLGGGREEGRPALSHTLRSAKTGA